MTTRNSTLPAGAKSTAGRSSADIAEWNVEDTAFWESKGKRIAYRNLEISEPAQP